MSCASSVELYAGRQVPSARVQGGYYTVACRNTLYIDTAKVIAAVVP